MRRMNYEMSDVVSEYFDVSLFILFLLLFTSGCKNDAPVCVTLSIEI